MQGQRSTIGSLPETLSFNHGSTSSDGSIDQQICWNNLRNPAQSRLPDYMVPSNETNIQFLSPVNQERQNIISWNLGESSSSGTQNNVSRSERKTDHGWSSAISAGPGPSHLSAEQQYVSTNILSLSDVEVNLNNQIANHTLFSQGSTSSTVPHDLNRSSGLEGNDDDEDEDDDDDCQVMECTPAFTSNAPGKERMSTANTSSNPFAGPSATSGFLMDEIDGRPGCSLDGRRMACKRKALEGHLGQSSGSGSSNYLPCAENSLWRSLPTPNNMTIGASIPPPTESSRNINLSEQVNPRLGLTVGGATTESPVALPASRSAESFRRNFRLRINGSHQQASIPTNLFRTAGNDGNVSMPSERDSSRLLRNESLDLRSVSAADNGIPRGQPVAVQVPSLRRSAQRWDLSSSSRAGSSSSFSVFGERDSAAYEEPSSRSVPRNISQHPMFIPATDLRNLNQNPANWSLTGGNIAVAGNVASTSRGSPSSGAPSASPSWVQHRNPSQHPRRLSEYVRRSLLSSAGSEPGGQNGNTPPPLGSAASQEMALSGRHGHRPSSSRSALMLERQLDGAVGVPYSWRSLAAASEGRSRLVSEIRNVLDLMRRGEALRFEDVMILDQSVFFGMADIHDRHRDMRLDVDNMSYEELLALEERIGNVCTGLSEETILNRLKQRKYVCIKTEEPVDAEPCCVCQEEYKDGEDLGKLDCGHDFHTGCIKQWLMQKNLCPICKTTGLKT
ncbi:putative E3 ubiquitin-protein ligase RHG1A [Nicotiana tabacum]|uniref:RING-type E3 ubiquitin transferase n=2 Tax=Nicotiana TaxID=4085 RepID=A0A1S3XUZ7_TOBAC|nr:PREDICTED: probable E3 ubiquitin-protein ligase HIP1 [Nicotiana sylvestris]XP_009771081.1 PREDICTED: probable E3 ubiquitin-protein ligase HIP1 [Nicotiana sylvestris]XP_009771082.1 PREDICTED: probable E3 ubiquitin-protein ligase HIP1 [Nicotiana sylvestris]